MATNPPGIPGLDVSEWSPYEQPPKLTPNQPEFHGSGRYGAPANPIGEVPPLQQGPGALRRAGQVAGRVARVAAPIARVAGPLAAGADAVSHFNDYKINDPEVDSSASGTLRALGSGDFAGAGRSLSKGLLETGLDVGSSLANTLDYVTPGTAPVSTAYNRAVRNQFGDQLIDNSGNGPVAGAGRGLVNPPLVTGNAGSGVAPVTGTITGAPAADYSNEGRNGLRPDPGLYQRNGNSFTDGSSSPLSRVSTIASSGDTATNADVLAAARGVDAFGPGAHNPDGTGGGAGIADTGNLGANSQHNRDFDRQVLAARADSALRLNPGRNGAAAAAAYNDQIKSLDQREGNSSAERVARIREAGETQRSNARNATDLSRERLSNATTQRGQDLTLTGHQLNAQVQREAGRRQQAQLDRAYQLDVSKFGVDVAEKNRTAAESEMKAQQGRLESTFRTTDDKGNSVPDHAKIAEYNAGVDATIPRLVEALRAQGTPQAMSKAQELEERKQAALSPADHDMLTQLFKTKDQLRAARSHLPGGAEYTDSNNLLSYKQAPGAAGVEQNLVTPNRIRFAGGSSATPNDLTIPGGANAILPDIGKVRNYDLTRGLRRPE